MDLFHFLPIVDHHLIVDATFEVEGVFKLEASFVQDGKAVVHHKVAPGSGGVSTNLEV